MSFETGTLAQSTNPSGSHMSAREVLGIAEFLRELRRPDPDNVDRHNTPSMDRTTVSKVKIQRDAPVTLIRGGAHEMGAAASSKPSPFRSLNN